MTFSPKLVALLDILLGVKFCLKDLLCVKKMTFRNSGSDDVDIHTNELFKNSCTLKCNTIKLKNLDVCLVPHVGVSTNAGDNHFFSLFLARLYTSSSSLSNISISQLAVNKRTKQVFRLMSHNVTTGKIKGAQY